jgi:hypothetical protein
MCIICNMGHNDEGIAKADLFLGKFRVAGKAMKEASDALLVASDYTIDPAHKRRYRRIQKQMAKLTRDWNRLEQEREVEKEIDKRQGDKIEIQVANPVDPSRCHTDTSQIFT